MELKLNDIFREVFTVNDNIYSGFITIFRDKNKLHINDEYAVKKGFKAKVMNGNILNGFISYFIGECLPIENVIIHTQEISFKNPVYLNDILNFEAVVFGVYESVKVVEFKYKFTNNDSLIVAKGKIQIGLI